MLSGVVTLACLLRQGKAHARDLRFKFDRGEGTTLQASVNKFIAKFKSGFSILLLHHHL